MIGGIGSLMDCLEAQKEKESYEALLSEGELLKGPEIEEIDTGEHYRHFYKGIELDPYRIAKIYGITDHMQFFILKKGLKAGGRGHKDLRRDIEDIKNACDRWLRALDEDGS